MKETQANRSRRVNRLHTAIWLISTCCVSALAQTPGQTPPPGAAPADGPMKDLKITVSSVSGGEGRLVRVPVNKAVLVDFSEPVREVRLAKPDIAEVTMTSPRQLLLTGKSFGTTQMIVWVEANGQHVFDVAVEVELERMVASIRAAVPRAKVQAHATLESVVLTGTAPSSDDAQRIMEIAGVYSNSLINHMRVAGVQQVLLRCTVAEVNRSATRQLGFNGWVAGDNVRDMFFINNLNQINPANIGAAADALVTAPVPMLTGEDGIPVTANTTLSFGFPRAQMQIFVQAMRENGLLRVLAEPNLVALNGQKASFLAGGEVPIPIATEDRINVTFKEFGVRLNFTPVVLDENRIRLHVAPEISEPDTTNAVQISGISIPGFTSRRVETTVELGNGQTFAIGGLLNDRVRAIVRKVPGLGDIPVLGTLFTSSDYQQERSELVVLVTPELVEGISSDQVTYVPGARHVAPNDFELFLMGEIEGKPAEAQPALQPRVNQGYPASSPDQGETVMKLRGPLGPAGAEEGM